ncbi:MAG: polysaccharide biosynthesis tyrosine autokinase [Lachnospiraceae bacterium]|nr:polysaccharide biosynthesis tyrosine autokinase [Lachnospiraceae bacterium]
MGTDDGQIQTGCRYRRQNGGIKGETMDKAAREYGRKTTGIFDVSILIENAWKGFKQYWWIFLIIISLYSSALYVKARMEYQPYYKASSTFVISLNQAVSYSSEYYDNATAFQMGQTFPYILNSGVLQEVVASDLGLDYISETITAEAMEDSNLFELSVTGSNPQQAYDVLQSVIKNYPSVAEFVIGDTQLHVLDETGVPEEPENEANFMPEAKKGAQIAILICLLILAVYATTRNTIRKEEDFKRMLNIRCIGSMPMAGFKKRSAGEQELVLLDNKKIPPGFLEATRTLRTRIMRECREKQLKTFLITSSVPGEGKSTVAANIALSLAQKEKKVLLIDADMRNPSLAKTFGIKRNKDANGFREVVMGKAELSEVICPYKNTTLSLILGSTPMESTERLLSRRTTQELLEEAGKMADYVIIDTPPGGMLADAGILAEYADGAIFVVRQDWVRSDRVLEAIQNMAETGIEMTGCILNCTQTGITGYGSGYSRYSSRYGSGSYGYGYGYGSKNLTRKQRKEREKADSTEDVDEKE